MFVFANMKNRFRKHLSHVVEWINSFENGCRGLQKWVLKLKQGFAGGAKGCLETKMKRGRRG